MTDDERAKLMAEAADMAAVLAAMKPVEPGPMTGRQLMMRMQRKQEDDARARPPNSLAPSRRAG